MNARAAQGFTLLEVLVAVFIMSLVITFAFQAYRGIAEAYTRVTEVTSRDRSARILLDRIERELTGTVLVQREEGADPLKHPYFFLAEPTAIADSTGFELRFITQTPLRSPGSPPAALGLVTYAAAPSQTGPGFSLLRQEEPVPAFLAKDVKWDKPQTVADNVASFTVNFGGDVDPGTQGWDSTSEAQLDALPEALEIAVSLWETGPDGEPFPGLEFTRVVHLPVRPFRLSPEKVAGAADCGQGMTATACVQQFSAELAAASPSLSAAINDALAQTANGCWNDPQAGEPLGRLKVLLAGLPGFDQAACR